ncbi:hypothetical protein MTO96_002752 [Rhipicephalus appendiculatus]
MPSEPRRPLQEPEVRLNERGDLARAGLLAPRLGGHPRITPAAAAPTQRPTSTAPSLKLGRFALPGSVSGPAVGGAATGSARLLPPWSSAFTSVRARKTNDGAHKLLSKDMTPPTKP